MTHTVIKIANGKPEVGGGTSRDTFKDARLGFTHFACAGDDSATPTEAAYATFLRSMAFQSCEDVVNIVIPVALRNEALREDIVTGILISVKDHGDTDAFKFFFLEERELFGLYIHCHEARHFVNRKVRHWEPER